MEGKKKNEIFEKTLLFLQHVKSKARISFGKLRWKEEEEKMLPRGGDKSRSYNRRRGEDSQKIPYLGRKGVMMTRGGGGEKQNRLRKT